MPIFAANYLRVIVGCAFNKLKIFSWVVSWVVSSTFFSTVFSLLFSLLFMVTATGIGTPAAYQALWRKIAFDTGYNTRNVLVCGIS